MNTGVVLLRVKRDTPPDFDLAEAMTRFEHGSIVTKVVRISGRFNYLVRLQPTDLVSLSGFMSELRTIREIVQVFLAPETPPPSVVALVAVTEEQLSSLDSWLDANPYVSRHYRAGISGLSNARTPVMDSLIGRQVVIELMIHLDDLLAWKITLMQEVSPSQIIFLYVAGAEPASEEI